MRCGRRCWCVDVTGDEQSMVVVFGPLSSSFPAASHSRHSIYLLWRWAELGNQLCVLDRTSALTGVHNKTEKTVNRAWQNKNNVFSCMVLEIHLQLYNFLSWNTLSVSWNAPCSSWNTLCSPWNTLSPPWNPLSSGSLHHRCLHPHVEQVKPTAMVNHDKGSRPLPNRMFFYTLWKGGGGRTHM